MQNEYENRIIINPKIMVGKPIIKGTRITVEFVLKLLAQGEKMEEILEAYPHLERRDIYAVLEYAEEIIREERVVPIGKVKYA